MSTPGITLDPIVSLAVGMAESPGMYAFLLGSGVSRDAGVPTGGEVLRIAQEDLYRLITGESQLPGDATELDAWLTEQGYANLGYSDILALLGPDAETRRAYLAKHFEGREPGRAHRVLAELAKSGLIRVFVTTNFDRLLEQALGEVGIVPVLVMSADDLRRSSQREHTATYIVKAHGDYLQETIRNTAAELARLEEEMEAEVQEIFDRYGIVVLGYSGSDEALMRLLSNRNSRHGVYWVTRTPPGGEVAILLESLGGRNILRDSAADLLTDLQRRIDAFRAHPSGDTPQIVAAEVVALLRARDEIGVREKLRDEWRALDNRLTLVTEPHLQLNEVPPDVGTAVEAELLPGLERILAVLLPLVEHRSPLFQEQAAPIDRILQRARRPSSPWLELGQWAIWWIAQAIGAFAMAAGRYDVVGDLLRMRVEEGDASVASMHPSRIGVIVAGRAVPPPSANEHWRAPEWEHLAKRLASSEFLSDRYPELLEPPGVRRWLNDFSFLVSYGSVRADEAYVIGYWGISHDGGHALAMRLRSDAAFRHQVAEAAFGMSGEEFAADARPRMAEAVSHQGRRIHVPGDWGLASSAIDALPEPPAVS